jgi:hypothetical protein
MIEKKDLQVYNQKYQSVRHHAWAGSVFLAILLAVRLLLEISNTSFENMDTIILILGAIIIVYTLIALFYTYKYRSGLAAEKKVVKIQSFSDDVEKEKIRSEVEKERLKLEKKKAKTEAKKVKKAKK